MAKGIDTVVSVPRKQTPNPSATVREYAPKARAHAAWAPRLNTGAHALYASALKGKGAMAPQGGGDHSDVEIARAVVYMANAGGANFAEPKAAEAAK